MCAALIHQRISVACVNQTFALDSLLNVDGGGKISRLEIIALLPSPPDTRMRMAPSSSTRSPSPSQLLL